MLFKPKHFVQEEGSFILSEKTVAVSNPILDKPVLKDFFYGHAFHLSTLEITPTDELTFRIGTADAPTLGENDYAIHVSKTGVCVVGKTEHDLIYGYLQLLDSIVCEKPNRIEIPCFTAAEKPRVACRMVHFCVFPETELWELQKFIRFAGALRYTHFIIEFWGMLRYDVLGALGWHHAFTKKELAPILQEARDLGMQIIPMFNHWGHASASRVMHGKHVVLDNDPSLAYLFSEDGWRWAIEREEVKTLLRQIRAELIDLCGEGDYFHIGCDEAYNFRFTEENMKYMCGYFAAIADELAEVGRETILWGDMFLYRHHPHYAKENVYDANAPTAEAEKYLLSLLDRRLIIADWQYNVQTYPVETSLLFKKEGFRVITCPWQKTADVENCAKTVLEHDLFGIMHTTWHTLSAEYRQVARSAILAVQGEHRSPDSLHTLTAMVLRKVYFTNGDYKKSGWAKYEIGVIT